jgi:hypothetical protein
VLTDNLMSLVALDSFRALVPGRDSALRVEQKNGIIFDALNQQAEDFIGLQQPTLSVFFSRPCPAEPTKWADDSGSSSGSPRDTNCTPNNQRKQEKKAVVYIILLHFLSFF